MGHQSGEGTPEPAVLAAGYPEDLVAAFEAHLGALKLPVPEPAVGLRAAMEYSLLAGGKRIRPAIVMATQRALGKDPTEVLPLAVAVEMIHTYSLIHDDLPAMDDDDLRRGRPTLHRAQGEAAAILAGDALYAEAIRHLLSNQAAPASQLVAATAHLTTATGLSGMVAGQYMDVEGLSVEGAEGLAVLHSLKTGALIRACSECVLLLDGSVPTEIEEGIRTYAWQLGVLFQIVDDILDVTGVDSHLGKRQGSDARQGKRTYVTEFGLDGANAMAEGQHEQALGALAVLGDEAAELRAIADHVATRTK